MTTSLVSLIAVSALAAADSAPTTEAVRAGPLTLEIHVSRTAHLFHVVDQISNWSPYCHDQYLAAFGLLSDEDQRLLARYRDVRKRHGWGGGLEQAFYTDDDVETAISKAREKGVLVLARWPATRHSARAGQRRRQSRCGDGQADASA